jgi:hypothetical protein
MGSFWVSLNMLGAIDGVSDCKWGTSFVVFPIVGQVEIVS